MADLSDRRHPYLRIPDVIAMNVIGVTAALAAVVAMVESYTNLYEFAIGHQLAGWRASAAPFAIDTFIVIGELILFVRLIRDWDPQVAVYGWLMAGAGFAVSVAGNIGHLQSAGWQTRAMSALWPVAATAALAAGLMILKRVTEAYRKATETAGNPANAPGDRAKAVIPGAEAAVPGPDPYEQAIAARLNANEPAPRRAASPRTRRNQMHVVLDEDAVAADVRAGMSRRDLAGKYGITPYRAELYQAKYKVRQTATGE